MAVRQALGLAEKGGLGGSPGAPTPLEMLLDRRHKVLTFDGRKQRWLVAQGRLEGGHSGGRGGEAVVSILDPWELFAPSSLVGGRQALERRFELLIGPLCLAIRLRMETGRETDLGSEGVTEFLPDAQRKLWAPV